MNLIIILSKGGTSFTVTDFGGRSLLAKDSLTIDEAEYGEDFRHVINTATFRLFFAGDIASLLVEDDVEVVIRDGTTPLFTGYVRPISAFEFEGMGNGDTIDVSCLHASSKLEGTWTGTTQDYGTEISVCAPASPEQSFVHIVLGLLGWARGCTTPAIARNVPIPRIVPNQDLAQLLSDLLYSNGYYYADRPDGSIEIRKYAELNPVPVKTFSKADQNIIKRLQITRKEDTERAVTVGYRQFKTTDRTDIYAETVGHLIAFNVRSADESGTAFDARTWVWPFEQDNEGNPPTLTGSVATWSQFSGWQDVETYDPRYANFRKKFNKDGSLSTTEDCLIPFPAPDVDGLSPGGYRYVELAARLIITMYRQNGIYGTATSDIEVGIDSDGIVTKPADCTWLSVTAAWNTAGLTLRVQTTPQAAQFFSARLKGFSISGRIEYLFNNMDADDDENAPRVYVGDRTTSAELTRSIVADYCYQAYDAEAVARALYAALRAGTASWQSLEVVAPGTVVLITHPTRGVNIVARIRSRKYTPGNNVTVYDYVAEGVEPFTISSTYYPYLLPSLRKPSASKYSSLAKLLATVVDGEAEQYGPKAISLKVSGQVFSFDAAGTPVPAAQRMVLSIFRSNHPDALSFVATNNSGAAVTLYPDQDYPDDPDRKELRVADFGAADSVTVQIVDADGVVWESATIVRVQDGATGPQGATGATGATGAAATAYWLVTDAPALSKSLAGVFTPASVIATGKSKTGSASPADYAGRFIIAESTDGSTWTNKYTSSANEASKTYTPSGSTVKAIRIRLYLAGGTTTLLDEEIVTVVSDGATGATGVAGATGATGPQGAAALGVGFVYKASTFGPSGTNDGEIYIHGFTTAGVAADVPGFIYLDNAKITVAKGMVNPNVPMDGYLLLQTTTGIVKSGIYCLADDKIKINNEGTFADINEADYVAIGEICLTGIDVLESASLYERPLRLAELKGKRQARCLGIASSVATGNRTVTVWGTAASGDGYIFSGTSTRQARPGDCVFCRGGSDAFGASDTVKALRVFDGYYWATPNAAQYHTYKELALLNLAAAARVYDTADVTIPSDIDAAFDVLVSNRVFTDKLSSRIIEFLESISAKSEADLVAGLQQIFMGKNPRFPNDTEREHEFGIQRYLFSSGSREYWEELMKSKRYKNRYGALALGLILTGATMGCGGGQTVPGYAWIPRTTITSGTIIGATESVTLDCTYDDVVVLSVWIGTTRQAQKIVSYDAGSSWSRKTVAAFRIFQTTSGLIYINGTTVYRSPNIDTAFSSLTTLPVGATAITSFSSAEADLCAVTATTVYWRPVGASAWSSLAITDGMSIQVNNGSAAVMGDSVFVSTSLDDIQIAISGVWSHSFNVDDDMSPRVMALENGVVYYDTSSDTSPSFAGFNLYGEKVVGGGGGGYEQQMRWLCAFGSNVVAQENGGTIYVSSGGGLSNKLASDLVLDDVHYNDNYQRLIGIVAGVGTFSIYTSDWQSTGMGFVSKQADANGQAYYSLQDGTRLYDGRGALWAWVNFASNTSGDLYGTYSRTGTTVTATIVGHGHKVGHKIRATFTSGGISGVALYTVTGVNGNTFTFEHPTSGAASGNITLNRCAILAGRNVTACYWEAAGRIICNLTDAAPMDSYHCDATENNTPINVHSLQATMSRAFPVDRWNFRVTVQLTTANTGVDRAFVSAGVWV